MIAGLWAFVVGCTIPVDVVGDRLGPAWVGVAQDGDGEGPPVESDCEDLDPEQGAVPEVCDGVDNDCDHLVDEGGVCAVVELFELHGNVDLLFVVDASEAATEVRERFLDVLPGILQPLYRGEVTAQIAVIGANGKPDAVPWGSAEGRPYLRTWTSDLTGATTWVTEAIDGLPGDLPSFALDVTHSAVLSADAQHDAFDRPGTKLAILFVTPEPDSSLLPPGLVADELAEAEQGLWSVWALLPFAQGCNLKPDVGETPALADPLRELVLTEFGGGHLFDACQGNYGWLRTRLADHGEIIEATARPTYPLSHAFQPGSLVVRRIVDGREELLSGYIPSGRTLTFPEPPPAEGVLRVEYDLLP